jgi:hypothetical protein
VIDVFSFLISPFPECLSHGTRSVSSVTHAPSPWTPPIVAKDQTRIFTVKVIIHNNKIKSQHPINKYKKYRGIKEFQHKFSIYLVWFTPFAFIVFSKPIYLSNYHNVFHYSSHYPITRSQDFLSKCDD